MAKTLQSSLSTLVSARGVSWCLSFSISSLTLSQSCHYRTTSRRASLYCTTLVNKKLVGGRKKFTNEHLLNNMAYADDMVLLADSKSDLEELLRSFDSTCSTMGLTISTAETKLLWPSFHLDRQSPLSRLHSILDKVMS